MHTQHILFLEEPQPASRTKEHVILPPPAVGPIQEVFAEAMLEKNSAHQQRSPLDWAVSLAVHVAVLGVLLMLPLYFTSGLDVQKFNLTFLATPPARPPPAPLISTAAPRAVHSVQTRVYKPGQLTAPTFIPRVVASMPADAVVPDVVGVPEGALGGIPGVQLGG